MRLIKINIMNYKLLLTKYIQHVIKEEGTTFLYDVDDAYNSFTEAELNALREISEFRKAGEQCAINDFSELPETLKDLLTAFMGENKMEKLKFNAELRVNFEQANDGTVYYIGSTCENFELCWDNTFPDQQSTPTLKNT
jgi:hypothetical protein